MITSIYDQDSEHLPPNVYMFLAGRSNDDANCSRLRRVSRKHPVALMGFVMVVSTRLMRVSCLCMRGVNDFQMTLVCKAAGCDWITHGAKL